MKTRVCCLPAAAKRAQAGAHRTSVQGSVLLVGLLVAIVIGIVLGSYLLLIQNQNLSVARSQSWNAAIGVAEAGIEEALAHLNPAALRANPTRDANGWTFADGFYRAPRRFLGSNYYNVIISPDTLPIIYATGYTRVPISSAMIQRIVRATTTNSYLFLVGMAAQTTVDFKGKNIETDSYDSTDPNYSTNGKYDPAKAKDRGDVATNSSVTNSLDVGNARIKGRIRMGPAGLPKIGPNGSVGDAAWVDSGTRGIKPGWFTDDMNVEFPDLDPPFTSGSYPVGKTVAGTNYTYALGSGNYYMSSGLTMRNQDNMLVTGQASLYVTGDLVMLGGSYIQIAPGGSLKLYVGGGSAKLTTVNTDGNANTFQYYGLPANTSLEWGGNAEYVGTIYAPKAAFTLGGGGNNVYDFQGACMVWSVVMNGHFKFHYDENLAKNGPLRGYIVTDWREL